jgi:hypothetical protein
MADTAAPHEASSAARDDTAEVQEIISSMLNHYQQLHADEVFKNAQLTAKLQLLGARLNTAEDRV